LKKNPDAPTVVFAVWEPMLATDLSAPTTRTLARLSDRRVRQYYDADHLLAKRMKADARAPQPEQECCTRKGILWDLMAIYTPGTEWTDKMPTAVFFNGPVVDVTDGLREMLTGKGAPSGSAASSSASNATAAVDLVFLTRGGCVNSAKMRASLTAALQALNRPGAFAAVDQDTLPANDPRTGYPTPTLLYRNRDVFGMPEPAPPYPEPT
jgi:hypothetical protein